MPVSVEGPSDMVTAVVLFPSLIATALCATAALAVNSEQGYGRTAASRIPLSFWMVAIMTIKLIPTSTKFSCEQARMALQKLANYHRALHGEE
jgi:G:T/U-mismatch repair DNA glycosylase